MIYLRVFLVVLFQVLLSMVLGIYLSQMFVQANTFAGALFFQAVIIAILMLVSGNIFIHVFLL